jgi:hypothetical protein
MSRKNSICIEYFPSLTESIAEFGNEKEAGCLDLVPSHSAFQQRHRQSASQQRGDFQADCACNRPELMENSINRIL